MEDSRKGKRSRKKGLPPPDPHVEGGNGKKAIVYNTKKRKEKGEEKNGLEKKQRGKEQKGKRNTTAKRKNLVPFVLVLGHVRGYFLYMYA